MSEFEKWYKEKYPQALKQNTTDSDKYALEIWQAATAESNKRIAELQAHINVLRENLDYAYYEVNPNFAKNIKDLLATTPAQSLQAHDNELLNKL